MPPLHSYRKPPGHTADQTAAVLAAGASPFDVAELWECGHDRERLTDSARSAWKQYAEMCAHYGRLPTPLSVVSLVAYMLWYVCVRQNSSANLNSQLSALHAHARVVGLAWPDFSVHGSGASMTARIAKVQKDWPAEVRGAPALTLQAGLTRAILYLESLGPNLWALQWRAILSLMHAMLLRPSEIIPLDKFPVAHGTRSGFAFPRRGDFRFEAAGIQYRCALSKTMKGKVDYRMCTAAALDTQGAVVNAPRAMREYLQAAGLWGASPQAPVFFYRSRSGALIARLSRGTLLRELRHHILAPALVPGWQQFTLRSLRPGGATDFAAAGVPNEVIRKLGKWASEMGAMPYDRVDHHLLRDLAGYQREMLALQ